MNLAARLTQLIASTCIVVFVAGCGKYTNGRVPQHDGTIEECIVTEPASVCGWAGDSELIVYGRIDDLRAVEDRFVRFDQDSGIIEFDASEDCNGDIEYSLEVRLTVEGVRGEGVEVGDALVVSVGEWQMNLWRRKPLPGGDAIEWTGEGPAPLVIGEGVGFALMRVGATSWSPVGEPMFAAQGATVGFEEDQCRATPHVGSIDELLDASCDADGERSQLALKQELMLGPNVTTHSLCRER